jgi:hypothetical protein
MCYSSYLCVYCIQSLNQFVPLLNMDHWYQSGLLFIYFSLCMSPTRYRYKKLGLKPIEPLEDRPRRAQQQPIGDKNKYDGAGDPIKMFLKEAITRQRNKMMENFTQILRRLPTGEASSSSGHPTPFKVHVNFYIPLF